MIVKCNVSSKTLLQKVISESVIYGDLIYKFERIVRMPSILDHFININTNVIKECHIPCLLYDSLYTWLYPITVCSQL